ncbi:MAG: nucleotidyltransferase [Bacteroidales bacterium]|jgi:NDP-sugar pyrophosphorylase family protein|nr:nucleotidyltransferase [Bacteroidales bacterium]
MAKPTLLVLAAGMGSRYGGLKQIDGLGPNEETIIDYSIYDAVQAGFGKVVMVIRKSIEDDFKQVFYRKYSGKINIEYVLQEIENVPEGAAYHPDRVKPWGTAHAVLMAADAVKEPFCVINGDDFYGADAFRQMASFLTQQKNEDTAYCMVGYQLARTLSDYGFVSRGICKTDENDLLLEVTECTQIKRIGSVICYKDAQEVNHPLPDKQIVSMNFWGFTPAYFKDLKESFGKFIRQNGNNLKAELYIPTVLSELIREKKASVKVLSSTAEWFGVTYKEDRSYVVDRLKTLTTRGIYPSPLWNN